MEAEFEIPQQVNNGMYIATGVEECMVLILFVGLVLFLASQIYRCGQAVVDPYARIDKDAWTDNLEKGGLQSFM